MKQLGKQKGAQSEKLVARIDKVSLACMRVYIDRNNLKRSDPSVPGVLNERT